MILLSALLAAILGAFTGKLMAMTVHFLPAILFEGCDKGREPQHILKWFFQKPFCWYCQHPKSWKEGFPVLGYLSTKEKCSACGETPGMAPVLLEAGMALLFAISALIFPVDPPLIFVLAATSLLICCFITDYEHGILPDQLTLGLLWVGLIASLAHVFVTPAEAIIGAAAGYGIFRLFNLIYLWLRGFDGMYPGDFKLNAAIGACIGLNRLVPVLIIAFFLLIVYTAIKVASDRKGEGSTFLYKEVPYACSTSVVTIATLFYLLATQGT